jgi:RND family efflux transporter MFP subunit
MNRVGACWLAVIMAGSSGCSSSAPSAAAPAGPPLVMVAKPLEQSVVDYADFTGRTEAPEIQNVQARVSGYIVDIKFQEGAEVKKGQDLFVIDPRPFEAELNTAKSQVDLAKARATRAAADLRRGDEQKKTPGVISQQEYDKLVADKLESDAAVRAAESRVEAKQLDVGYTQVKAEQNGRVSRIYATLGNLINKDTLLTTIVSQDPMYVYFDVDERTVLQIQKMIRAGTFKSVQQGDVVPVAIGLANETAYPHEGVVNFIDNRIDPNTGTVKCRGTFANPVVSNGNRVLGPGLFVRVRVPLGQARPALLVSERALGTDQGQKFLYVVATVDGKTVAEYRPVSVGAQQKGGLRVVMPEKLMRTKEGLRPARPEELAQAEDSIKAGDLIVVNGLQRVRPGSEVRAETVPMPTQLPLLEAKAIQTPPAKKN